MEKFSLYDFVSFVLPGGTFLILCYLLFSTSGLQLFSGDLPETEVIAIPFLVLAYLFGHLISLLGKKVEKHLSGLKTPWIKFLNENPSEASAINSHCKELFGYEFISDDKSIDVYKSDKLYDKIWDFVEVQENDKKINILMSQYGFFRNSSALWLSLFFILFILILLKLFSLVLLDNSFCTLICFLIISLILSVFSIILLRLRKLLAMAVVYRTFLVLNIKPKN
jgi:hypothetical protein